VESARHLQRALQLVATLPASLERDRSELVVTTALLGGGWRHGLKAEEASRLFERGVELARNLQRADSEAGLHGSYGRLLAASGSADAYVAHVERALEIVHGGPEDQTLPLQAQLSHAMRRAGRLEEGLALGDQVIARLQGPEQRLRGFDFSPLIWLRALRAQTWIWTGRWQQADVELRSLLALDPGLSSLDLRTLLAYLCAELALMRSDADGLLPIVQVALRLAEPHGSSYALALARTAMGIAELLEGRWEQAEDLFGSTFELTQRTGAGQELGMSLLALQAECRLRRGDPPAALRTAGAALEEARKREMRYYTGMVRLCYARTLLRQDEARLDEAERALDEVEKLGREIGAGSYLPFLEAERAQLALRRGDDPAYRRHLAVSLQMFDELGAPRRS
jgi:tetratricopeptide (TPR) repeat protein